MKIYFIFRITKVKYAWFKSINDIKTVVFQKKRLNKKKNYTLITSYKVEKYK